MNCKKVKEHFRFVGMKGKGAFADFGEEIPRAAQQFLLRSGEMEQSSGTEMAIYEPKRDAAHLEGTYYVGMMVNRVPTDVPTGMDTMELKQDYATVSGPISQIGSLHDMLVKWTVDNGYKRNPDAFIVETYHPLENGEENVEIFLPIHS
ncbi:MAG: effector binding domain-containing protein [Bacillota bacterium]|uniref:effector binding domain-containing protein n=1 Tax=Rossellomorea sp. FM04394 TaxID=3243076 RepID=UPI0035A6FF96